MRLQRAEQIPNVTPAPRVTKEAETTIRKAIEHSYDSQRKSETAQLSSGTKENLYKVLYSSLDAFIRVPFRQVERAYDIAESALGGPVYRTLTEFVRHGVVAFVRDTGESKTDYKKRLSSSLRQMVTRSAENVVGFLAFKPNLISTATGRAGAGFANMFVRLLPRMIFVANDLTPARDLNTPVLAHEFIGRSVMRALPRNSWGMFVEQLGIGILRDFPLISLVLDSVKDQKRQK